MKILQAAIEVMAQLDDSSLWETIYCNLKRAILRHIICD